MFNQFKAMFHKTFGKNGQCSFPDEEFMQYVEENTPKNTFDLSVLETTEFQKVFVYDHMKENHRMHALIAEHSATFASSVYTRENFILWCKKQGKGSFPIALRDGRPDYRWDIAPVKGELYIVESLHLVELDHYKQNGVEFERVRVPLQVPHRPIYQRKSTGERFATPMYPYFTNAWMYVGKQDYWNALLDGGYNYSPCERISGFVKDYYEFTHRDYRD